MSNEYNEFFKTEKKGVYDLSQVDDKINESIKKVIFTAATSFGVILFVFLVF